jgi:hypothetical protein
MRDRAGDLMGMCSFCGFGNYCRHAELRRNGRRYPVLICDECAAVRIPRKQPARETREPEQGQMFGFRRWAQ